MAIINGMNIDEGLVRSAGKDIILVSDKNDFIDGSSKNSTCLFVTSSGQDAIFNRNTARDKATIVHNGSSIPPSSNTFSHDVISSLDLTISVNGSADTQNINNLFKNNQVFAGNVLAISMPVFRTTCPDAMDKYDITDASCCSYADATVMPSQQTVWANVLGTS